MTSRKTVHGIVAMLAVAGVTAGGMTLAAGAAQASSADALCTPAQLTARLVPGDPGAGNRWGYAEFTAKPGVTCTLPGPISADLTGARDVLLAPTAPPDSPPVVLSNGSSAHVLLHWTQIGDWQETPLAISFNPQGGVSENEVTLTWSFGPVDATPESHTIDYGAVEPGVAPAY